MTYEANLSTTSLNAIIKELKKKRQLLDKMVKEFFFECCRKIIEYANENIRTSTIGSNVLFDIMTEWEYVDSYTGHSIILRNVAEKAAYVEFGVGIVAEGDPHPLADEVGYDYNVPTLAKQLSSQRFPDGTWIFYQNQDDLDLPVSALEDRIYFNQPNKVTTNKMGYTGASNRMLIRTRGTEPTMFLFNAVLRFVSTNDATRIWENIKQTYWG